MPRTLSRKLVIGQADGSGQKQYGILVDQQGGLQWFDESQTEDEIEPGAPLVHTFDFFGGGLGETVDLKKGGYYYSSNVYVGNPWAIRPRPTKTAVTLTGNTTPVARFFEAWDAADAKYLYCLAGAKSFKIKLSDKTLAETVTFTALSFFKHGTYNGNGTSQNIAGLGFQPAVVIIKVATAAADAVIRTANMTGANSKRWSYADIITTGITSLNADGFSVGAHATVNSNGLAYYWEAWKAVAGVVATGSYTGSGAIKYITGVGFRSVLVHVIHNGANAIATRFGTFTGDQSLALDSSTAFLTNRIKDFSEDGFTVGTDAMVNTSGQTYYWVAFGRTTGGVAVGTYDGNGKDDRPITDCGFQPEYILLMAEQWYAKHRCASLTGDSTQAFGVTANVADAIQSFDSDGFTIGKDASVNYGGGDAAYIKPYHYVAFANGDAPVAGKSAVWPSPKVVVAMGKKADAQRLDVVAASPTADTWSSIIGLGAQHLQVKDNKLARAHLDRQVSLCAKDNLAIADNWGSDYAVGPPGTVITDLVEWGGELGVSTEDGFYMFDGLAVGRQQIPFLGGVSDTENGKGTIVWGSQILIPTADGLYRWQYGAVRPVGPDTIPGYVDAEGTSNEPIHLQHFGSAFLGDYIYNACKDPSNNYHIIYGRPEGDGFRWDFLLTTTEVIKALFIDSNRCLWFNWGNAVAYIQLRAGGEPSGGNFGEASSTGSIYLPEIIWPTSVRLRKVEVYCRNNQTGLTWAVYAYRDGGTAAQVGSSFATDGINNLFWAAASNLTARRLRLRLDYTAGATYTPDTVPPEVIRIRVYGHALPDAANIIKVAVRLQGDGRKPATTWTELMAHENAGVRQIKNIITDATMNVILYDHDTVWVKQKGYQEPEMGMVLFFRAADTS